MPLHSKSNARLPDSAMHEFRSRLQRTSRANGSHSKSGLPFNILTAKDDAFDFTTACFCVPTATSAIHLERHLQSPALRPARWSFHNLQQQPSTFRLALPITSPSPSHPK